MSDLERVITTTLKRKGISEVVVKIEDGQYVVLAVSKKIEAKIAKDTIAKDNN